MWPNPQEPADLVTFTEETLMENFIFCAVLQSFEKFLSLILIPITIHLSFLIGAFILFLLQHVCKTFTLHVGVWERN